MAQTLTAKKVQGDVISLLSGSSLAESVSGQIYYGGTRPRDSAAEDITVMFTSGLSGQTETGVVTLNVYVPDIEADRSGVLVEDCRRTAELEALAQEWADSLTPAVSAYKFSLDQAIYTERDRDVSQHFVVIRLRYEHFDR